MRPGRHVRIAIGVTTLLLVPLATAPRASGQTGGPPSPSAQPATESRERVRLAPADRDRVLADMRTMLESLSWVMQGLVAGDPAMSQKAARTAGVPLTIDPGLERRLPPPFVQFVQRAHQRFDRLADAFKKGAARDAILKRLAAITASCVACHARYRVDESQE